MNQVSTSPTITHAEVQEEKLFDFLPEYFGRAYIAAENLIYKTMRQVCEEYKGGHWLYFNLGGFKPEVQHPWIQ